MNLHSCSMIQESLAWRKDISDADKKHILSCPQCSEVAFQMEQLDSLIKDEAVNVPDAFADNVMNKILQSERPRLQLSLLDNLMDLLNHSLFRWGVGGFGFLVAFSAH